MKKTINKLAKDKTTMTTSDVGVLIESFRSEFKIFGEGQDSLKDKVESSRGMIARIMEDNTRQDVKLSVIENNITKIDGKLAQIESDIKTIKTDFGKRLTHLETIVK